MSWVAAGTAAVGIGGSLLSKPASSSSSTKDPTWLGNAKQDLVGRATDLSHREQEKYTGPRVAGLSENEQQASDIAKTQGQQTQGLIDKSTSLLDDSATEYSDEALDPYFNPYTERVTNNQIKAQNEQYDRARTELNNSDAGARGGDRMAFAQSELERNQMDQVEDITSKGYKEAWDQANKNFFADSTRKQQAAAAYERTAGDVTQMNQQEIQALMATGGTQRLLQQAGLDTKYADFLETRDWDVNNLDTLMKAISTAGGNTTTTKTGEKPGMLGQILGAGATVAGMYFQNRSGKLDEVDISNITDKYGTGTGISPDAALSMSLG